MYAIDVPTVCGHLRRDARYRIRGQGAAQDRYPESPIGKTCRLRLTDGDLDIHAHRRSDLVDLIGARIEVCVVQSSLEQDGEDEATADHELFGVDHAYGVTSARPEDRTGDTGSVDSVDRDEEGATHAHTVVGG
jgi:hypothetical protein